MSRHNNDHGTNLKIVERNHVLPKTNNRYKLIIPFEFVNFSLIEFNKCFATCSPMPLGTHRISNNRSLNSYFDSPCTVFKSNDENATRHWYIFTRF